MKLQKWRLINLSSLSNFWQVFQLPVLRTAGLATWSSFSSKVPTSSVCFHTTLGSQSIPRNLKVEAFKLWNRRAKQRKALEMLHVLLCFLMFFSCFSPSVCFWLSPDLVLEEFVATSWTVFRLRIVSRALVLKDYPRKRMFTKCHDEGGITTIQPWYVGTNGRSEGSTW